MSESEKPQVLVSSDVAGIFGKLGDVLLVYALCLPMLGTEQLAVEMIAWQHLISDIEDKKWQTQEKVSVAAMHGPMLNSDGSPTLLENLKMLLAAQIMAEIPSAIESFPQIVDAKSQVPPYFLLHEPDLRPAPHADWLRCLPPNTTVLVENVLERGSLKKTIARVQTLKQQGLPAGIMFDLVHYIKEQTQAINTLQTLTQTQFDQTWTKTIEEILQTIEQLPGSGLHLPIGVNGDSLPLHLMNKKHWQELAQVIRQLGSKIKWITLENQQHNLVKIKGAELAPLAIRNQHVLGELAENGVI